VLISTITVKLASAAVALALVSCGIMAGPAQGAPAPGLTPPTEAPPRECRPVEGRPLETRGGGPLISSTGVGVLLALGGAAVLAKNFANDERISAALRTSPFEGAIEPGDVFGDGRTAGLGALGLYTAGRLAHSERLSSAGGDLCESLLITWTSVWALKFLVDEDRPTGGDYSFPSGHTATAFATASVLASHFGPAAGVPAYTLAATTALARLEDRRHYLSDVLFGAAIGYVVGSEVTSRGRLAAVADHLALSNREIAVKLTF
jgi:membrane-associated phospholipid phosphatase